MARSVYHHRTPMFEAVFADCVKGLKWLYQTNYDVLTLSCSGTGAFEAAFQNFFSKGDTVICVGGGKFGERWGQMARVFGLVPVVVDVPWGQAADTAKVAEALKLHPQAKGIVCVASETSTGVRHPYEAIGQLIKDNDDCILIVDAITALGVWDISPERDCIDVLVTGSQKALMLPPGLAFLSVSDKAWRLHEKSNLPKYYFDLSKERKAQATNQTAFTPAVSLMTGLRESLAMMKEEGLANIFARHARMAKGARSGVEAIGLKIFASVPVDSLTSVVNPEGVSANGIYAGLRDRANITIAGGQDQLKGKIFRVAHMGYFDELDVLTVLSALEIILQQEGYRNFTPGASVAAASKYLAEGFVKRA